jgi:hypothetical protein
VISCHKHVAAEIVDRDALGGRCEAFSAVDTALGISKYRAFHRSSRGASLLSINARKNWTAAPAFMPERNILAASTVNVS